MFETTILSVIALCAGFSQTETKLNLYSGDNAAGKGTYTEKFDHHGRKTSVFRLVGSSGGVVRTITQTKVIDSRAFPISEEEVITEKGPRSKSELVLKVRYDDTGAAILDMTKDKVSTTTRSYVPLPGYSRADLSDLWFSKIRPTVGTTVRSTVFDIENARWQRVETTYVGKRSIYISERRLEVHEVRDVRDGIVREVYLDDKGQPVLMKSGQYRTEKHF